MSSADDDRNPPEMVPATRVPADDTRAGLDHLAENRKLIVRRALLASAVGGAVPLPVLDDSFAVDEDARFTLAGGGREIVVEWTGGYRFAQVFAPAELDVVCLEPMMAPVAALSTGDELPLCAPGATASAGFRIRVR